MAYHVSAASFGRTVGGKEAACFSITNSAGSCLEISSYGCTVKRVVLRGAGGEDRQAAAGLPTLSDYEQSPAPVGAALFWEGGAALELSRSVWQVAEIGENSVALFQKAPLPAGGTGSFAVRFAWMDRDRLVIDMSASCDRPFSPVGTSNICFTLPGDGTGSYLLRDFCTAGTTQDQAGPSQPLDMPCDRIIHCGEHTGRLQPMAELTCPESDLSLTAYTTAQTLHIHSVSEPFPAVRLNMGTEDAPAVIQPGEFWNQRIIYGFDAVYHGPKRILPFGM